MGFQGNLKTMHLGDVFQNILQNRSAGNLRINTWEMGNIDLFFMEGELTLFHSGNLEEIQWSRVLLAKGDLTEEEVNMIESQGIKGEEELAGIISSQIIGEEKAAINFQHIIEEEIYELFFISDCDFSFESAVEIPALYTYTELFKRTSFNTNMILMEAARRSDEHSQIGDISSHEIFSQVVSHDKAIHSSLNEEEGRIFDLVDGFRNVSEILRDSGSKRHNIVKILKKFLELQVIKISDTKDLLAKASHLASALDYDSAAKIYRRLVDTDKLTLTHRELLAETFLKLQQKENAIMQLEIMASEYILRKDFKKAIDGYQKIVEIDPTKLGVRELIANNYMEMGKKKDAIAELKHVLQLYVDSGFFEKAKEICGKLLKIDPEDLKVMDLMAKTCLNRGERADAVDIWNKMADIYIGRELFDDAMEVLKKIIKAEPSNDRAKEMLNVIMIKMGKEKTRQKVFFILGAVVVFLILISAWFIYLDQSVKKSLEKLKTENNTIMDQVLKSYKEKEVKEKTKQVLENFEKFKEDHPYSFTRFEIEQLKSDAESKKNKRLEVFRKALEDKTSQLEEEFGIVMESLDKMKTLASIADLEVYRNKIKDDSKLSERLERVDEKLAMLKKMEAQAGDKANQISECIKNNKIEMANTLGQEILANFKKTSYVENVMFYVNISASEIDSKVQINGEVIVRGLPIVQSYRPDEKVKIIVQKDGYYDFTEEVFAGKKSSVNALMKRKIMWMYDLQNPINANLIYKDGVLYLSSRNGRTVSLALDFDTDTYKELWTFKMQFPSSDIFAAGQIDNDTLFIGSSDKYVYAINLAAGAEIWKKKMAGAVNSGVSLSKVALKQDQKMLFVVSNETKDDGVLYGLNVTTGESEWQRKIRGRAFSDVLSTKSKVYVGTDLNKIIVVRASTGAVIEIEGKENEKTPLEYKSFGQFKGSMGLREIEGVEYLFASSIDQNIYCFDEKSGNKIWNFQTNSPNNNGLILNENILYCSSSEGLITAIKINESVKSGKAIINWSMKYEDLKDPAQVFVTENTLYVGGSTDDKKGRLLAIRKNDGKLLWTFDTPKPINSRPLVIESRVIVGCDDNKIYMLKELK